MSQFRRRTVAKAMILLWIAVVLAAYYSVHKPFGESNVVALGQALAGLGVSGAVAALGIGVGLLLLRRLDLVPIERAIWAAGIGMGAVSLAGLGLGAVGLLRPWLLWIVAIGGLAATGPLLWKTLRSVWCAPPWRPKGLLEVTLSGYCAFTLMIGLVRALTPPTAWDSLVYHLSGPKLYLTSGRLSHSIDLPYLGFPQLTEMLFTWSMGLAGERGAAAIHWFCGVLTVFALVTAGRRWSGEHSGWLAAAILLSARTIVMLLGWAYVDLALLLYATLAFLALMQFAEQGDRSWLTMSGVFAGLALSTKYTAMALLPALGAALVAFQARNWGSVIDSLRSTARHSLIFCAVALLVWAPWLAKNLWLTGNPTYPFFFDGIHWDDWRSWWYDRPGTGLAYVAPSRLLTALWDATTWGVEGGTGYSATIGPLFLALLPILFLVWRRLDTRRQRWLRAAAAFCAVLYGFWLWGVARTALLHQTRLLFPAFGVLALMVSTAVEGLEELPKEPLDLAWLIRATIVGVLALTSAGVFLSTARGRPLQILLGIESRDDFLARRLGWYYPTVEHINKELPPDSVVLFLWEPRTYHCTSTCHPDALLDRWLHTIHRHGHNSEAIARAWRGDGVTHVLLHRAGLDHILEAGFDPVTGEDVELLERVIDRHMTLMESFGSAYELYRLKTSP